MRLPGVSGCFEALQLPDYLEYAALAKNLGPGRDMLPSQQPAHELCGGHRLDLLAQFPHGKPVNTREQSALAPLCRRCAGELSSQY